MIWPLISPDSGPLQPVVLLNQTNEKDDEDIDDDDDTQNDDDYGGGSVVMTIHKLFKGLAKRIITILTFAANPGLLCDPSVLMWKLREFAEETKFADFNCKLNFLTAHYNYIDHCSAS